MHELSIVASLFEIVKLKVGKLAGVVPEFLRTAFDMYKKGTIADEAVLEIEEVTFKIKCQKCQAETEREDFVFICPACGSKELQPLAGTELLLEKIELET
jgi:hydrogenase nickel incorporation protein HypA/HybF